MQSAVQSPLAKSYMPLRKGGHTAPMLYHTLKVFCDAENIKGVVVVVRPQDKKLYHNATKGLKKLLPPIAGGATRQESVRLGLESLEKMAPQQVVIHDGARPFVTTELIFRCLAALKTHQGAIAARKAADSLLQQKDGGEIAGLPREKIWHAQTPQAFLYRDILRAHQQCPNNAIMSDDSAVARQAGLTMALVEASATNIKITYQEDMRALQENTPPQFETFVGTGYDIHRLVSGVRLFLCGVEVPHSHGLLGHSDADVGLHALTDALLGALGHGDIGQHFPPDDPSFKGKPSHIFVEHAVALLKKRKGFIMNADITLLAQAPKLSPYRAAMRERVASILAVDTSRVNVKMTTTEGLGAIGRGEGIAAQAVVSLALPV